MVEEITGFCKWSFPSTYLGCPIGHAKKKKIYFKELIKKIQNKLQMLKGKLLSYGGKVVLINHICNILGSVTSTEGRDKAWWMPGSDGKFKVSSTWELCRTREEYIDDISKIWEKGLSFPINQLQQIMEEWLKADDSPKLKQLVKVVPAFITWEIWKMRNVMKHGTERQQYQKKEELPQQAKAILQQDKEKTP
ncbi:hypothetical protein H5410_021733 [Solanum commersonii]|uniref:Uncharacterized protein n=1 Tax=Solanum commersonii TaxID=4109 RepID=A0A9J5ZG45_SOLCO|nr:hypothetical protein H5410_021733 [Solanum commersonii]